MEQHSPRHAADDDQTVPHDASRGGATPTRAARPHRGRRRLGAALLALLLVLAAGGYGLYRHLNRNISSVQVSRTDTGAEQLQGLPEGVAQNILVIGTDSRQSSENCQLGGMCGEAKNDGRTNADVMMLVHIAADHRSMSMLSIPRDTVVDIRGCSDGATPAPEHRDRINSTLNHGVGCTLRTVHDVTGLPVSHFMMVDFAGVISLSDAVGGVDVCVDNDVYDTYSHLKLAKGRHTLKGNAALQFLRTRHGFGDGSDLGRTVAQHLYLSAMQRELESAGTLLNPAKVYRLAEAGTKALTVDEGLADVATLARVGVTVGGIPTSSTSFVTLPTVPNPDNPNTVVVNDEKARPIFAKLAADEPLAVARKATTPGASASATPRATDTDTATATATPSPSGSPEATPTGDVATDGEAQVSSENSGCAHVATLDTVMIRGEAMNPTEAYHASPRIRDSDA